MMKIQLISDIHLEFGKPPVIENAGADVLVLAGDICTARHLVKELDPYMPLPLERHDIQRFFDQVSKDFKNVVYVMGNHEHYKHTFNDTAPVLRNFLKNYPNVHLLDNESAVIDDVKFVGATLWTNMNNYCPITMDYLSRGMSDFRIIKFRDNAGNYFTFSPKIAYSQHQLAQWHIQGQTTEPCVVVTHHAPSFKSIHPMYEREVYMNGGYASSLEDMMNDNIKLWCHGHMHQSFDYKVNNTRVVCNPHGYPNEREDKNLKLILEI